MDVDEWTATPGTRFAVLPETPHTVWNDGDEEMHALVEVRPALDVESFFETMFGLARDGATNGWGCRVRSSSRFSPTPTAGSSRWRPSRNRCSAASRR